MIVSETISISCCLFIFYWRLLVSIPWNCCEMTSNSYDFIISETYKYQIVSQSFFTYSRFLVKISSLENLGNIFDWIFKGTSFAKAINHELSRREQRNLTVHILNDSYAYRVVMILFFSLSSHGPRLGKTVLVLQWPRLSFHQ